MSGDEGANNPVQRAIDFHNELVLYEAYDAAHLLHPNVNSLGKDEVLAWMNDFRAVDLIYMEYNDVLDGTLRVKAEMIREPFVDGIKILAERAQSGRVEGIHDIVETIGFGRLISFVNDMRDIAQEQVRRWQEVLGMNAIQNKTQD